jgi:hypothetical protein
MPHIYDGTVLCFKSSKKNNMGIQAFILISLCVSFIRDNDCGESFGLHIQKILGIFIVLKKGNGFFVLNKPRLHIGFGKTKKKAKGSS